MVDNNKQTKTISATTFTPHGRTRVEKQVCRELALDLHLNDERLTTILSSPNDIEDLVIGLLYSEGLIKKAKDITAINIDNEKAIVSVETAITPEVSPDLKPLIATCGTKNGIMSDKKFKGIDTNFTVSSSQIISLMNSFMNTSKVYSATRGIHSAAVANPEDIIVSRDDIGRHNALDKVLGSCLRRGIEPQNHLVLTSGRISSEILLKVATHGYPVLLTKAVPTDMGASLAKNLGITLVRCSYDNVVTVYSHDRRITD
jgi:FdhD protein